MPIDVIGAGHVTSDVTQEFQMQPICPKIEPF
jgi:hypothetical protein